MTDIETLERRKAEAIKRRDDARKIARGAYADIENAKADITTIEHQITAAKGTFVGKPRLSDHALLRYLERKYSFTFDEVRREIMTPDREGAIRAGATTIKHDGFRFIVTGGTIVSVVPE